MTSYNGVVLLTGEVPDQGTWASVGAIAKDTEKVRVVNNELVVAPNADLSARSNDTYITSKVKSRMIEANKFPPNAVKVVTERGVVYLMGIVSKEEGNAAAETAATTCGRRARREVLPVPRPDRIRDARRPACPRRLIPPRSRRPPTRLRASRGCRVRSCSPTASSTCCIAAT